MGKKLKRLLIIIGSILLILIGVLWFLASQVEKAINPDPDFNTVFPSLFNDEKFLKLKPGISADQVSKLIGDPYDVFTPVPVHKILYSDYDVSIDYSSGVIVKDTAKKVSFLVVSFDTMNLSINTFNSNYCDKEKEASLLLQKYTVVVKEFGIPKQEVICNCKGSIWSYSKLRDGGYRGKHPVIKIRRLIFTPDNRLEKIVIGEGSPYNKYIGTCNE